MTNERIHLYRYIKGWAKTPSGRRNPRIKSENYSNIHFQKNVHYQQHSLLYSCYGTAVGADRRDGEFTLHSDLKTDVRLPGSRGILINSKTRAVNVCETGILPWTAQCACATIFSPLRIHTIAAFSWRDLSIYSDIFSFISQKVTRGFQK